MKTITTFLLLLLTITVSNAQLIIPTASTTFTATNNENGSLSTLITADIIKDTPSQLVDSKASASPEETTSKENIPEPTIPYLLGLTGTALLLLRKRS